MISTFLTRRRLLVGSAAALLAAPLAPLAAAPAAVPLTPPQFWQTVRVLQEHLFPAEPGTPSIGDINATAYFAAVLLDPRIDVQERAFLRRGVELLDAFAHRRHSSPFTALDTDAREALLRRIEDNPDGQYWLSLVLLYLFEALLADPVYGGNRDQIGWRWLQHQPGAPRPPRGWYEVLPGDA